MSHHPIIDVTASEMRRDDHAPRRRRMRRGLILGVIAGPLALGAAGLSLAQSDGAPATPSGQPGPAAQMAPAAQPAPAAPTAPTAQAAPTAIGSLTTAREVAAKGEVAEIYGNKFIVQDGTGRALVETGPRGEGGTLVKPGETVTVQGRFEHGFLHAAIITHPDGSQVVLGPAGGPRAGGPPRGGPGALAWVRDKVGLGPRVDVPAMTATVERAGYSDVRVTGSGPRHLEVAAKGRDGRERVLHVDVDGTIRER